MSQAAIQVSIFDDPVSRVYEQQDAIKQIKSWIRDAEIDYPRELEELIIQLKDLSKQVKEKKEAFRRQLIEENAEYSGMREKLQNAKEELALAKLALFTKATDISRETGDIDETIVVEGLSFRLQTQKEVAVYLNGKVVK